MPFSNCCFLTHIQVSQETGKVVWYYHLFKNFPVCSDHTVKSFNIVNGAEVDVFWNSLAFSMIQQILSMWSLVPLLLQNPACTSGIPWFTYWSLAWCILIITLLTCEMSTIVLQFEHSLALPFFGTGVKTDLFWSDGHWWVFQICWHIECSTLTTSSFRILNNATGNLLPPRWNWKLILLKTFKMLLTRPWLTNLKMTVRADCAVFVRNPLPQPVTLSLLPTDCQWLGLAFGQASALSLRSGQHPKLSKFSTNAASWLAFEQQESRSHFWLQYLNWTFILPVCLYPEFPWENKENNVWVYVNAYDSSGQSLWVYGILEGHRNFI